MDKRIGFIGGGNMASAMIGGLLRQGVQAKEIEVVEPWEQARERLFADFGVQARPEAGAYLHAADMIVWAVKPQTFKEAAAAVRSHNHTALHLSVAAGITTQSIAQWLGTGRIIRCMPNTPALIGKGITGLYGLAEVSQADKDWANDIVATTGATVWLSDEAQLDAVTALSGSGPAYMFYLMEAMTDAGVQMGLTQAQAHQLAVATFIGAGELARASDETPASLRAKVTSKGGTTHAAIASMEASGIKDLFTQALFAAHRRAGELGVEFGKT